MSPDDDTKGGARQGRETDDDGWSAAAQRQRDGDPNPAPAQEPAQEPAQVPVEASALPGPEPSPAHGDPIDLGADWTDTGDQAGAARAHAASALRGSTGPAPKDADLRAAVGIGARPSASSGARPRSKTGSGTSATGTGGGSGDASGTSPEGPRRPGMNRRTLFILVVLALALIAILVFWFLGQYNSRSYYVVCGETIRAERGRSFPPWGTHTLSGDRWEPIETIVELSPCDPATFDDRAALEARFRDLLLFQADAWLQQMDTKSPRTQLPVVRAQLEQAGELGRGSDNESIEARKRVARLLGDVARWEAQNQLDTVREHLGAAAKKLREAVDKKPVHVRDADAWRKHIETLQREIAAGPPSLRPTSPTKGSSAPATGPAPIPGATGTSAPAVELAPASETATPLADGAAAPPEATEPLVTPPSPAVPNPPRPASGTLL